MKDVKVNKGRFAVIKKNGKILQTIEAVKGLRIEGGDDVEVVNKTKTQLTSAENAKMKVKENPEKPQKAKTK